MPKNTVFIDDKLENIKAADELGFQTIHFMNPKEINNRISFFLE